MPSHALADLSEALEEVSHLQNADPTQPGDLPQNATIARSVGRASVVLLSSHFERYFYAVNEEAVEVLNGHQIAFAAIPESLRLLHTKPGVEALAATSWER